MDISVDISDTEETVNNGDNIGDNDQCETGTFVTNNPEDADEPAVLVNQAEALIHDVGTADSVSPNYR